MEDMGSRSKSVIRQLAVHDTCASLRRLMNRFWGWRDSGGNASVKQYSQTPHTIMQEVPATNEPILAAFDAAVDAFYDRCRAENRAENTLHFYRYRLAAFRKFLVRKRLDLTPAEVTTQLIREFITDERNRVSAVTSEKSCVSLKVFFSFLIDEGLLDVNPTATIRKPKVKRKIIEAFSREQIAAMLKTCSHTFSGYRDLAIIMVLFDCGLRASELCGLIMDDMNWEQRTIKVTGKGNKERIVPFGEETYKVLQAYLPKRKVVSTTASVFIARTGNCLDRHDLDRIVKAVGKKAGVKGVRVSPHIFRHTFAVTYSRNGGDAFSLQKLLGHSSLEMTRRYTELSQNDVIEKHRRYSPGDQNAAA